MTENYKRVYYKMSYYPPYKSSSNNIKVELDLTNYATKTDLKNITHVGVSSFTSKTNLAALKTEVDKIDANKLKTVPVDLAKLTNAVENDLVKKTVYNPKVTSIEGQIAGLTKNTIDNLADITKLKAIDTNSCILKTKLASDVTTLPNISALATKTNLNAYLQTSTFNSKVTDVQNKIKAADIIAKSADTKANTIRSDLTAYAKKTDVATDITAIKNDYVTNTSLTSQLNNLKSQQIATEVTGIDNKTKKIASDVLALKNELEKKEYAISEIEIGISIFRGFFSYLQQNNLVYECKVNSIIFNNKKISKWESTGVLNRSDYYSMNGIKDTKNETPILKNDEKMYVYLKGSHFQQNYVLTSNNDHVINDNVVNIYNVYKLDPITSRDTTFTIENSLFGALQITKNADTSKYNYKGYGICFDESEEFTHVRKRGNFNDTTMARNVIIFGVDMSFSKHANNKRNNIYVMGKDYIQKINDTTIYAEKMYYRNFTDPGKKFVLSLHYNGNNSYLYVNGNQELKFKAKTDQLVIEKLCLGNLSDQWTTSESEKIGLYGNIYDFVVDCEHVAETTKILDMHRHLITKHSIIS